MCVVWSCECNFRLTPLLNFHQVVLYSSVAAPQLLTVDGESILGNVQAALALAEAMQAPHQNWADVPMHAQLLRSVSEQQRGRQELHHPVDALETALVEALQQLQNRNTADASFSVGPAPPHPGSGFPFAALDTILERQLSCRNIMVLNQQSKMSDTMNMFLHR